jgi:uncharacterized membrane-anchored protein YjiN (DUF445 family)
MDETIRQAIETCKAMADGLRELGKAIAGDRADYNELNADALDKLIRYAEDTEKMLAAVDTLTTWDDEQIYQGMDRDGVWMFGPTAHPTAHPTALDAFRSLQEADQ